MTPTQQAALPMSLNPHQLLMGRKETAEGRQRAATLIHDDLVNKLRAGPSGETEEAYIEVKALLTNLQKEILDIDNHINEGAYIRCGQHWKCESEAPTKIFLQQEKWRGQQRFMGIIEVDGDEPGTTKLITNQPEIEAQINHSMLTCTRRGRPTLMTLT